MNNRGYYCRGSRHSFSRNRPLVHAYNLTPNSNAGQACSGTRYRIGTRSYIVVEPICDAPTNKKTTAIISPATMTVTNQTRYNLETRSDRTHSLNMHASPRMSSPSTVKKGSPHNARSACPYASIHLVIVGSSPFSARAAHINQNCEKSRGTVKNGIHATAIDIAWRT
jgi:hypothetical protein